MPRIRFNRIVTLSVLAVFVLAIGAQFASASVKVYILDDGTMDHGSYGMSSLTIKKTVSPINQTRYVWRNSVEPSIKHPVRVDIPPGDYSFDGFLGTGHSMSFELGYTGNPLTSMTLRDGDIVSFWVQGITRKVWVFHLSGPTSADKVTNIFTLVAKLLALGAACGGLVFATRFLWSFYKKIIGGPTWRE